MENITKKLEELGFSDFKFDVEVEARITGESPYSFCLGSEKIKEKIVNIDIVDRKGLIAIDTYEGECEVKREYIISKARINKIPFCGITNCNDLVFLNTRTKQRLYGFNANNWTDYLNTEEEIKRMKEDALKYFK